MVIVTALPAQAAVQAATLNERTVSAVSTYTGTNAALATSKTAAINTATSTTNTTTNDATLTASKTTAKKAALDKTSLKLKKGKTYQLKNKKCKGNGNSSRGKLQLLHSLVPNHYEIFPAANRLFSRYTVLSTVQMQIIHFREISFYLPV